MPPLPLRLDDLYKMVAHIYSEQNAQRPASATFSHFVEVCGMLTIHAREKKREEVCVEDALCKALGWFFPLLAKFKVSSAEDLIFRKYPGVCPYCRLERHDDEKCKTVRGTTRTVDHAALVAAYEANKKNKPVTFEDWQKLFKHIYPRTVEDLRSGRSTLGLFEELGELAEAVRVFDRFPKYFAGEAADVFSYLMGIANEHDLRLQIQEKGPFSLETEFLKRYPGLCIQCGYPICVCPTVPESTVGRMAKELEIDRPEEQFRVDLDAFQEESAEISARVIERLGGYAALVQQFPFDRGKANQALMLLCLKLADKVQAENPGVAERLRSAAIRIGNAATYAGSRKRPDELKELVVSVEELVGQSEANVTEIVGEPGQSLEGQIARLLTKPR